MGREQERAGLGAGELQVLENVPAYSHSHTCSFHRVFGFCVTA